MLAKQVAIAGRENVRRGRRRPDHIAQPIDFSAFQIDARKKRSRNVCLAIAQQLVGLLGADDIAREQNHARRLNALEQGSEPRGHLRAIEPDDESWPISRMFARES